MKILRNFVIIMVSFTAFIFFWATGLSGLKFFSILLIPILIGWWRDKLPDDANKNDTSNEDTNTNNINSVNQNIQVDGLTLSCTYCNTKVTFGAKFCPSCGCSLTNGNVKADLEDLVPTYKKPILPLIFDPMYDLDEDKLLEEFLNRELIKASIDKNAKLMPQTLLRKRKILSVVFSILFFVYIAMFFFHFPYLTYIIGGIILTIFFIKTRRFNLMKYLIKEVKARPKEKISNIVMSAKQTLTSDNSMNYLRIGVVISVVLTLIIFWNPRILYEKVDGGYAVRFYLSGITNNKTATIPATYKGENVVALRGNTFSNMPSLEEVKLPNTIVEIRGQAFKNDRNLVSVNIPSKLEYLGGGAFYNCSSIEEIELPDTLEYLGGEAFYGATSLKKVKLSNKLTEIRGSTFENCTSLESITIPDTVTRIGGHAFYSDYNLERVEVSPKSQLSEIGSSAFRQCDSLYNIVLPTYVKINERAFKESPTNISYYQAEFLQVDGLRNSIEVGSHGTLFFNIYDAYMLDNKVHATLKVNGDKIQQNFDLTFDGSKYYISDYLYVTTEEYDDIQDYFKIYISNY